MHKDLNRMQTFTTFPFAAFYVQMVDLISHLDYKFFKADIANFFILIQKRHVKI